MKIEEKNKKLNIFNKNLKKLNILKKLGWKI